ncbi:MAG: signal peptidase II [Acidimicrobiales bacterium]
MTDGEDAPTHRSRAPGHWWLVLSVAAGVVVVDQLTKWWAVQTLSSRTIDVVWTLRLNLTYNPGAAFSFFSSGRWGPWLALGAFAIVGYLVWQGRTMTSRLGAVAIGLILGGAVGNLTDRVLRGDAGLFSGKVVDFIDFQWWPVFNVADMGVVVGGILLVAVTIFGGDGDEPA